MLAPNNGAAPGTLAYVNNNYIIGNGTNVQPVNKWSIKGDHLSTKNTAFRAITDTIAKLRRPVRTDRRRSPASTRITTTCTKTPMCFRFSWDWTVSPTKFNHFYAGGNNWRQDHKSAAGVHRQLEKQVLSRAMFPTAMKIW